MKIKDLPPYLPKAFVAIEDRRFYQHWGVDPRGILRAIWVNIRTGHDSQGGSTITQQLARNLFLSNDKTFKRKFTEVLYAFWLERHLSKDQILELYLNRIYFGAGTYGVDAAARFYFSSPDQEVDAKNVTLSQAAMLAGLPKSPSRLSPTASEKSLGSAQLRAGFVLRSMKEAGFIDDQQLVAALASPAVPAPHSLGVQYYLDYVYDLVTQMVPQGSDDLVVHTTLDRSLQQKAEAAVAGSFCGPQDASDPKAPKCPDKGSAANTVKAGQVSLISIDSDGALRAMIGGKSYLDSQFNRAVNGMRQPGSSFKPFVYLTALESGKFTPDTVVDDAPITISTPQGDWSPSNYTDTYRGPVTLREALAESLNTVAVRLSEAVGPANVVATAQRLGITAPLTPDHSIALGSEDVTLLDLIGAYLPFAKNGLKVPVHTVDKIETKAGQVLFQYQPPQPARVIDENIATEMTNLMYGVLYSGTGRGAKLGDRPAAGKTGTSSDWRDAWFMGYTAQYVTGVWVGNDDNSQMRHVTGGSLPATIWKAYMTAAHDKLPVVQMPGAYPSRGTAATSDLQSFYHDLAGELGDLAGSAPEAPTDQPSAPPPPKKHCNWFWCN